MTTDYRKADPKYTAWVPHTAEEAIDLFFRFKRGGLRPEHHPETFVWVSRALNVEEGEKFEEWLCAPQGVSDSTTMAYTVDPRIEAERLQLVKEAEARDAADRRDEMTISEEEHDEKEEPDVEMFTPSAR